MEDLTCLAKQKKPTVQTLENGEKYIQSRQWKHQSNV